MSEMQLTIRRGRTWRNPPMESNFVLECKDCPILAPYETIGIATTSNAFAAATIDRHMFDHAKMFVYAMSNITGAMSVKSKEKAW